MALMNTNQLKRLERAYHVDEAINRGEKNLVIIRFGREAETACRQMDEWLAREAERFKDEAAIYTIQINAVPELVARYNLPGPSIVFFSNHRLVYRLSGDDLKPQKFQETIQKVQNKAASDSIPIETLAASAAAHKKYRSWTY